MEEKKEYLSEEQYQKANKKVKTVGLIVMLIGITALASGIAMLVFGTDNIRMFGGMPIILGIGVTIWGCMIRFIIGNQRQIFAYMAQQQMPIAQERIEKMAPTVGKAGASMLKEMAPVYTETAKTVAKEMAPVYGETAKEIAKGIKEGLKEEDKEEEK